MAAKELLIAATLAWDGETAETMQTTNFDNRGDQHACSTRCTDQYYESLL
jgi:hypothetical protein